MCSTIKAHLSVNASVLHDPIQIKASVGIKLATKLATDAMVRSSRVALRFSEDPKCMGEQLACIAKITFCSSDPTSYSHFSYHLLNSYVLCAIAQGMRAF